MFCITGGGSKEIRWSRDLIIRGKVNEEELKEQGETARR